MPGRREGHAGCVERWKIDFLIGMEVALRETRDSMQLVPSVRPDDVRVQIALCVGTTNRIHARLRALSPGLSPTEAVHRAFDGLHEQDCQGERSITRLGPPSEGAMVVAIS